VPPPESAKTTPASAEGASEKHGKNKVKGKDNMKAKTQDLKYARDTLFIRTPPARI
jgi:hypothetical protein